MYVRALLIDIASVNWLRINKSSRKRLSRELARAAIVGIFVRFFGMGVTFLVGVQLARYLGPEQYGIYATVTALAALLAVPAQFGLSQLITREVSSGLATGAHGRVRGAVFWFATTVMAAGCIMMAIGWFGMQLWPWFKTETFTTAYLWGLATIPLTALVSLALGALRGFHRVVSAQAYEALLRPALMAQFMFVVFITFGQMTAALAVALQLAAGLVSLLASICHLVRITPTAVRAATTERAYAHWTRSALPMMATEVMRTIDGLYPVLLIGLMAPLDEVGIFRVALALLAFIGLPSAVVNLVIMPHAAQLHAKSNTHQLQLITSASAATLVASTLAITFAFYMFGKPLIGLAFGAAYLPAWFTVVLMGIAYIVSGIFGSAAMTLNMCGQEHKLAQIYFFCPILGITLTLVLFPLLGVTAVAAAMIATEFFKGVWMTFVAQSKLGIQVSLFPLPIFSRATRQDLNRN